MRNSSGNNSKMLHAETASVRPPIQSAPVNSNLTEEKPKPVIKPSHQNIQKAHNSGSGHVVQQQGQTNIAQIGDNNQVTIAAIPDRHLDSTQKQKLIQLLNPYKDAPFDGVCALSQDSEGYAYAQDFFQVFKDAGWNSGIVVGQITSMTTNDPNNPLPRGLWVVISRDDIQSPPDAANRIFQALRSVGLNPKGMTLNIPKGAVTVLVGLKDSQVETVTSSSPVVKIEKGAKWISTDDAIFAPGRTAIENKGEINSTGMMVNPPTPRKVDPLQALIDRSFHVPDSDTDAVQWTRAAALYLRATMGEEVKNAFMAKPSLAEKRDFLKALLEKQNKSQNSN
jgi:hypothetical protein